MKRERACATRKEQMKPHDGKRMNNEINRRHVRHNEKNGRNKQRTEEKAK